jgi:hypothetical protein
MDMVLQIVSLAGTDRALSDLLNDSCREESGRL